MTQQEIIEGNKLIAEFMGYHFKDGRYLIKDWANRKNKGHKLPNICYGGVRFYASLDWLMQVVEKIDKLHWTDFENIEEGELQSTKNVVLLTTVSQPRETIWSRVVEFIKWYNQKNEPPHTNHNRSRKA